MRSLVAWGLLFPPFLFADTAILVALSSELDGVRKEVRLVGQDVELAGRSVFIAYRKGEKVYIVRTGAGIIHAARAMPALKRRNHPLWRELNEQIVALDPKKGKLQALRELASNARKFGRWAEAEQYYSEICNLELRSAEETVNNHLFLAECQAKQGKDYTASIQNLESRIQYFATAEQKEYGRYRLAKFYEEQGNLDQASSGYSTLVSSLSTSTWAAASLHQLAALKEKQGDLQTALKLYLEYPKRFPQSDRLAIQSLASALNVAHALNDAGASETILSAIQTKSIAIADYNTHLNLAWHYKTKGEECLGRRFLESGVTLGMKALAITSDVNARIQIHHRIVRRLNDFDEFDRILGYIAQHGSDFSRATEASKNLKAEIMVFYALAQARNGDRKAALETARSVFQSAASDPACGAMLGYFVYRFLETVGDKPTALAFGVWVDENFPNGMWANAVRLNLARTAYAGGDYSKAKLLLETVIATGADRSKMQWERTTLERAKLLYSEVLKALAQSDGAS
jgi:tetratricopeptide (TPR) repeat protein